MHALNSERHKIRRRADVYLLGKERHKKAILLLVLQHEPLEVLNCAGPCHRSLHQLAVTHVVGIRYRDVQEIISIDLHRRIERL